MTERTDTLRAECPEIAPWLDLVHAAYRRARSGTGRHKVWCQFVKALSGLTPATMVRDNPAKLDAYRELFAEVTAQ